MALDICRSIGGQYRALQTRRLCARAAGICAALVIAAPAQALSCLPHGLAHALHEVAHAKEGYVAAVGTLRFDEAQLPKVDWNRQQDVPPLTRIPARITGKALTKNGFTQAFNTKLTLEVACYGPWCAAPPSDKRALVFLKQTNKGYALGVNPCSGHIFYDPKAAALNQVERCYVKGDCPKPAGP